MEGGCIICSGPPAEVLPRVEDQMAIPEEVKIERGASLAEARKEEKERISKVSAESIGDIQPAVHVSVVSLTLLLVIK